MQFLADVELPCEECNATRYKLQRAGNQVQGGRNIHDVLNTTVKEALACFAGIPRIVDKLHVLDEVGLGYVRLGQSATTLSGGEAQRVKPASHLAQARSASSKRLQHRPRRILASTCASSTAESTNGYGSDSKKARSLHPLHPRRAHHRPVLRRCAEVFRRSSASSSRAAARCSSSSTISKSSSPPTGSIDMGPEGGDSSAARSAPSIGTPEAIAAHPASHTGHYLAPLLWLHSRIDLVHLRRRHMCRQRRLPFPFKMETTCAALAISFAEMKPVGGCPVSSGGILTVFPAAVANSNGPIGNAMLCPKRRENRHHILVPIRFRGFWTWLLRFVEMRLNLLAKIGG